MYTNGSPVAVLPPVEWTKSRYSTPSGNCVEVAALPDGSVAIRNSHDPNGRALVFKRSEIDAFVRGAEVGDFDFAR